MSEEIRIVVSKDGPYLVNGEVEVARQEIVVDGQGQSVAWKETEKLADKDKQALCRCGHSGNKPYCDGTHAKIGFDGTETASRASYASQAEVQNGPDRVLTDVQALCAFARFCDPDGQIWNLVEEPGQGGKVDHEAGMCTGGRLVSWEKDGKTAIEPDYPKSIGVVEDPAEGVSGPLWIRGGITVTSADGHTYETRNRVALCRCGASRNKPFCDGSHVTIAFDDGAIPDTGNRPARSPF
ncbi:CDGSH iron-sulfur domain-containing protein [Actinocorallia lasiicapitis]